MLLAAIAIAACAPGCGGGGGDTSSQAQPAKQKVVIPWGSGSVSKAEYVKRASGVCEKSWKGMLESFQQRYQSVTHGEKFAEASQNIFLTGMQFWFDDISYIGAPKGEKDRIEALLTALQLAVFQGEEEHIVSTGQFSATFAEFNRLARQYGLNSCLVHKTSFSAS